MCTCCTVLFCPRLVLETGEGLSFLTRLTWSRQHTQKINIAAGKVGLSKHSACTHAICVSKIIICTCFLHCSVYVLQSCVYKCCNYSFALYVSTIPLTCVLSWQLCSILYECKECKSALKREGWELSQFNRMVKESSNQFDFEQRVSISRDYLGSRRKKRSKKMSKKSKKHQTPQDDTESVVSGTSGLRQEPISAAVSKLMYST